MEIYRDEWKRRFTKSPLFIGVSGGINFQYDKCLAKFNFGALHNYSLVRGTGADTGNQLEVHKLPLSNKGEVGY